VVKEDYWVHRATRKSMYTREEHVRRRDSELEWGKFSTRYGKKVKSDIEHTVLDSRV